LARPSHPFVKLQGILIGAAGSAAGALATQLTYSALSATGSLGATGVQSALALVGAAAGAALRAVGSPAAAASAAALAHLAGALAARSLAAATLALATGTSTVAGLGACLAVSAFGHGAALGASAAASALARFHARQQGGRGGAGAWVPSEGGEDGLDALAWVLLEEGGEKGLEEPCQRLYALFAGRTTPRGAQCALNGYLRAAARAREDGGVSVGGEGEGEEGEELGALGQELCLLPVAYPLPVAAPLDTAAAARQARCWLMVPSPPASSCRQAP
jgi:hypothetical protein